MKRGLLMGILPAALVAAFVAYECQYQPLVYSLNIVAGPSPPPPIIDHSMYVWSRFGPWGFEQYHWERTEEMWGMRFKTIHLRTSTVVWLGRLGFKVPMPAGILGTGTLLLLGIAAMPGIYYGAGRRRRAQAQTPVLN